VTDYKIILHNKSSDLKKIAKCRIAAFPDSLSSKLGTAFVSKMLSMYLEKNNFIISLETNNECMGFVTALVPENEHACSTRESINFTFNDLLIGLLSKPWLFFHPIVLREYKVGIEMVKKKFKAKFKQVESPKPDLSSLAPEIINSVGLIDIAVQPKFQGKGYSTILLGAFESHCLKIGKHRMHLSVKPGNQNAIRSYKKNGWILFLSEPKQLNFYKEVK
jgi:hypothetical protein